MPIIQCNHIAISYEDQDEKYALMVRTLIETELPQLFEFFGIAAFTQQKRVFIYPSIASYQEYKLSTSGYYEDWMIGEQKENDIRFLSHSECVKTEAHADQTEADYQKLILHEFVHACQQEVQPDMSDETEWFWEALATNLSRQYDAVIPITCTLDDLLYHIENIDLLYETFFTLGQYMLHHLPHSDILAYIQSPEKLIADTEKLFSAASSWSK